MKNYIRLEPLDVPRKYKPKRLTEEEKLDNLQRLAEKLKVRLGCTKSK